MRSISEIRQFAEEENWEKYYVDVAVNGTALSNPWIDSSARFPLTDEQAVKEWGLQAVLEFCIKANDYLDNREAEANAKLKPCDIPTEYFDDDGKMYERFTCPYQDTYGGSESEMCRNCCGVGVDENSCPEEDENYLYEDENGIMYCEGYAVSEPWDV